MFAAPAEKLKSKAFRLEAFFHAEFMQRFGKGLIGYFNDVAALVAYHVQVVFHPIGFFVVGMLVPEVGSGDEAEFHEKIERMVDRCPGYADAAVFQFYEQFVGIEMGIGAVDFLENGNAFRGAPEAVFFHSAAETGFGQLCAAPGFFFFCLCQR